MGGMESGSSMKTSKAAEQPDLTAGRKDNSCVGFCWSFALAGELAL